MSEKGTQSSETSDADRTVGLIGLGLVGTALTDRLIASGYVVKGFDLSEAARRRFAERGGAVLASTAEVARLCRTIVLSLPDGAVVASVIEEMKPHLAAGSLVIDTTTAAPVQVDRIGKLLAWLGLGYLDATLSGSSEVIAAGKAAWLVGGSKRDFQAAIPIFEAVGGSVHHLGPVGSGIRAKLVSNLILGLNRAVLAEGLALAENLGLDLPTTLEVLKSTAAYSKAMDAKGAKMATAEYRPQARLRQHHKDVRLLLEAAKQGGQRLPLTELHDRLLTEAEAAGWGEADNAAIIEVWRRRKPGDLPGKPSNA